MKLRKGEGKRRIRKNRREGRRKGKGRKEEGEGDKGLIRGKEE